MTSRYENRRVFTNNLKQYKEYLEERGQSFLTQYTTPNLKHPAREDVLSLTLIPHTWTYGDRFYKLAHQYYSDVNLWWLIAWYNKTPTEFHLKPGDLIRIPTPLQTIIDILDV